MFLYNRINKEELKKQLMEEAFNRKTISFYRYHYIDNPGEIRDQLYEEWFPLGCFGRIYIAREGINAQMSVPEHNMEAFMETLKKFDLLKDIPIKYAIEDDGKSFYKLTIKVRPKIVADGLDERTFDVTNVGRHLSGLEFHELAGKEDTIIVDMRNFYESEIGHFEGAICPEADTFREEIEMVVDQLQDKKDEKILLYCTGGIRCEKASAYLRHHGFNDVNQLHGGILEYARQINALELPSRFVGKNFVFDERMGESVDGQIISHCHQCGKPCDTHTNCSNDACHLLFIQCPKCAAQYDGCCSDECHDEKHDPEKNTGARKKEYQFGNRKRNRVSLGLRKKLEGSK